MTTIGPQFVQTSIPIDEDQSTSIYHLRDAYKNGLRSAYHLHRDASAVDQATPRGANSVLLPTPAEKGIGSKRHILGDLKSFNSVHSGARENYSHGGRGQMVMGTPTEGLDKFHELDYHGNVLDHDSKKGFDSDDYANYGPQQTDMHEQVWAKHGKVTMIPSNSILHTLQPSYDTGSHSRITGELRDDEPAANVLIKNGTPELLDGHHRTAEWRGRGRASFPARILNLDQLGAQVKKDFRTANSRKNPERA